VTFNSEALLKALTALWEDTVRPNRYIVAFSGGLDSTVLLHALATSARQHGIAVLAIHIDHGLQEDSEKWAEQCRSAVAALDVEFRSKRVTVDRTAGKGQEAAAREARYAALASLMSPGDWILSAHHQDDQAETLLLNLLRGSGPAGIAGIAAIRPFENGWLARPMLSFSRDSLLEYANQHDLSWIEDPSNSDGSFDRNFLRHEVLPKLESRWPELARRLYRSSRIAGDTATLLDDLAAIDVQTLGDRPDRLRVDALRSLALERQRNVLRYAIRQLGLPTPSAAHLQRLLDEVVAARDDAEPVLKWNGVEVRRYRNSLYLLSPDLTELPTDTTVPKGCNRVELGHGLGALRLESDAALGLDGKLLERGLELRYRQGGEKLRPIDQSHTKTLKNLLQEKSIVPWMRNRIPLVFAGDELVAVADLWLAADAVSTPGVAIHWEDRPPIH
jgi:tRNA(Ile)-lysidine synthase